MITTEIANVVKIFDKTKPTFLATDWSRNGRLLAFSETLFVFINQSLLLPTMVGKLWWWVVDSPTPQNLDMHQSKERLLLWQMPLTLFILGCNNLVIAVDHKPLLKIFGDRSLDQISNPRLRNLKEKTLRYHFRMVHICTWS